MKAHPEAVDELTARIEALEKRVTDLEQQGHSPAGLPAMPRVAPASTNPLDSGALSGFLPVVGSALLGISGAYLLRAASGTNLVQRRFVAGVAVAYAVAWLIAAVRAGKRRGLAGPFFAATSVVILAPMLWEMCLRFQAMPAFAAAAVLAGYAAIATALVRQPGCTTVVSVTYIGAAGSALALLIGTHDMAPFALVLLAMVGAGEYAAARGVGAAARPLVALICDVGVWSVLFIYRIPASSRPEYPALAWGAVLAIGCALFFLWVCGLGLRVLRQRRVMTVFDGLEAVISFLLATVAVAWNVPGGGSAALGSCCIALSGACYASAFGPLRLAEKRRNFHVFAAWGASLLVAGVFLCAQRPVAAALLATLAFGATLAMRWIGVRTGLRMGSGTLSFHGLAFLLVAAVTAQLHIFAFEALIGQMPSRPKWDMFAVIACAVLTYAFSKEHPGEELQEQAVHLLVAAVAACSALALVATGAAGLVSFAFPPDVFHVALIRTVTMCAAALGLALGGSRIRRPAMTRIAYGALALVTVKLLFEDLRYGRMEYIAASICLVALTLIAVPRIAHRQERNRPILGARSRGTGRANRP